MALVGMVLLGGTMGGSWRFDDPLVLQFVQGLEHWHSAFFDAAAWQGLGLPFFTPLIALVFGIADGIFGLWSAGHYLLQGLALVSTALLSCWLVARQSRPMDGVATGVLFLLGTPTLVVAHQLMTAHYVWGLLLALLSCMAWKRFLMDGRWRWALASTGLYLLAMLGKEIYAPLPLVLLVLAWQSQSPRRLALLAGLAGHAAAAVLYIVWRAAMIGSLVGGYGLQAGWGNLWTSLVTLVQVFWGGRFMVWLGPVLALMLVAKGLWWHGPRVAALALALAVGVALPYFFITAQPDVVHYRFGLLPWWALSLGVALGLVRTGYRALDAVTWLAALALALALAPAWRTAQTQLQALTRPYDDFARHVLRPGNAHWVLPGGWVASDLHFQYGLARMALHQGWAPTRVEPFVEFGVHAQGAATGLRYEDACRCMRPVPELAASQPLPAAGRLQTSIGNLSAAGPGLAWTFSASSPGGVWYMQWPELGLSMRVPAQGASNYAPPVWTQGQAFRIVWQAPDGGWTQTPLQNFPAPGSVAVFAAAAPG